MKLPLEGIRIIDVSHVIAGPLATFYLAQLGAEVIKIEPPPGGDVMRAANRPADVPADEATPGFTALNAGKRSVVLDFRSEAGRAAFLEIVRSADAMVENFRPGTMERYGLDYDKVAAIKPDIVYCSISGFGQEGEWARRGAYDHVVQAATGIMLLNGEGAESPPMKVGFPVVDVATGLLSAMAIMSSLMRRQRDGVGEYIDASMVQASLALMYPVVCSALTTGIEPARIGNRGFSGSPTADTYRCTDGWLALAANTPGQFRKMAALLGISEMCEDSELLDLDAFNAPNGGFVVGRNSDAIRARIASQLSNCATREMERALNDAGVPAARVRTLGEFLQEATGSSLTTFPKTLLADRPAKVWTPGLGFKMRSIGNTARMRAPGLGADTVEVLASVGMPKQEIDDLLADGGAIAAAA